jgi:hypothetical protein
MMASHVAVHMLLFYCIILFLNGAKVHILPIFIEYLIIKYLCKVVRGEIIFMLVINVSLSITITSCIP